MISVRKRKKILFSKRFYSPPVYQFGLGVKVFAQKILDGINDPQKVKELVSKNYVT